MNTTPKSTVILFVILVISLLASCQQTKASDDNNSVLFTDNIGSAILVKDEPDEDTLPKNKAGTELHKIFNIDSLKINESYKVSFVSKNAPAQQIYYSPDKKNYVNIEHVQLDWCTIEKHIYINDSQKILISTPFDCMWISNSKILLNGTIIYDINDALTTKILTEKFYSDKDYKDIFSSSYKLKYSVNSEGTKIAYSFCDYVESEDVMYHVVGIFDIASGEYKEIARNRLATIYFNNNCVWDKSNNLYYDFEKIDSSHLVKNYVIKHNTVTNEKEIMDLDNEISVSSISPNLRYLLIKHRGRRSKSLYDTIEEKIIYTFLADRHYLGDEELIYLDKDNSKISIFNYTDRKEEVIISGFNQQLSDNNIDVMFSYVENYYTVCFYKILEEPYNLRGTIFRIEKR